MIIRQRTHWFRMLFIWYGSVLPKILPQLLILTAFSLVVLFLQGKIYEFKVNLNPTIFTLIGIALAIFLGFCNTASYDRYWEGRKLWGTLVVETRSLVRQIFTTIDDHGDEKLAEEKRTFAKVSVALAWALNYQLRKKNDHDQLVRLLDQHELDTLKGREFIPVLILYRLGEFISDWSRRGKMDSIITTSMNQQLNNISSVIGGCERILNTPLPFTYHVLLHRTVYVYCFLLPFGLVDVVGWMMPVLVLFISYTFISLDAIVSEIGEPFGEEANDLALNSICRTIEYSIFEQANIPQPPLEKPDTYFID
jgi:putative membrane protein